MMNAFYAHFTYNLFSDIAEDISLHVISSNECNLPYKTGKVFLLNKSMIININADLKRGKCRTNTNHITFPSCFVTHRL